MKDEKSHLEDVAEKANEYLNTRIELSRLKAMEYGALAFSVILGKLIILMVSFFVLIFSSLALAMYISQEMKNNWMGYLIVAGIYLLLFLIIALNRKRLLEAPLADAFIKQFHKPHED